jgi:hypothetical protein
MFTVAAASAPAKADLLKDMAWANKQAPKRVVAAGFTGSAAADDTQLDLFYGSEKVAELLNSRTGVAFDTDADLIPCPSALFCPAADKISLVVVDPPTTNPIKVVLVIEELPPG